jgi:sugar/nucleoside kinase (ribokinase family)
MFDLISIGNISIDMFFKGDSLTYEHNRFQLAIGGKYFVNQFHQGLGGGGANVAIAAARHGAKAAVVGKVGVNSFRKIIMEDLRDAGVETSLCQIQVDYMNVSSILISPSGERSIINYDTPHQHIIPDTESLIALKKTRMLYLGNLPDVSFAEREKILQFLHTQRIPIAVNLGVNDCRRSTQQIETFMKHVDIILVNGHEYAELIKKDYHKLDFTHRHTYQIPYLINKLIVVTDGEMGSYAFKDNIIYFQKAIPVKHVVDATGAGDGFVGTFLAHYLQTLDIQSSMNKGAHYSAKILGKLGAN